MEELKYFLTKTKYPISLALSLGTTYVGFFGEYLLSMPVFETIGLAGIGLTATSLIAGTGYFLAKRNFISQQMAEKKFLSFKMDIETKYSDIGFDRDIFKKINTLKRLLGERYTNGSTFAIRMFETINTSLSLYIENLEIIRTHKELELVTNKDYSEKIQKNMEQNKSIIENLDNFIEQIASEKENDSSMDQLMSSFETSVRLFNKLKELNA